MRTRLKNILTSVRNAAAKLKQALEKLRQPEFRLTLKSRAQEKLKALGPTIKRGIDRITVWGDQISQKIDSFRKQKPGQLWGTALEQTGGFIRKKSPVFYTYIGSLVLGSYLLSDLTALLVDSFIPEPPPLKAGDFGMEASRQRSIEDYDVVFTRNLFNSRGLIPGEDTPGMQNAPAVRTTLPFDLAGTLILQDEARSIGTILDRTSQRAYPVRVDDTIPNKAKITKVEARKVTFINLQNRRPEYVDLPDDGFQPQFSVGSASGAKTIEQVSANRFILPRKEIDDSLKDLHKVLTEARAIPHFENGQPAGFRLTQIAPGSIYEKLGLKDDDILTGINGESITSDPSKAWNYINDLKNAKQVELSVRRGGKESVLSYDIQ